MSFEGRYGRFDRLLHRVAFATTWAQRGTADLEERWYRRELAAVQPGPPVFVTALPRAGTTVLLELLAAAPPFAAHTYRDMPFVFCPLLWSSLSRPFRRAHAPQERAHGDGIQIGLDSPEAFEEMLWQSFWPDHYREAAIEPWSRCDDAEFIEFFATHRRKIIALRRRDKPTTTRYVSKNNVNIARLPALWGAVPDAIALVGFREPLQHAASLLRQHLRFLALHARNPFARRYMAGVGHHDFGAVLKPVDFAGWLGGRPPSSAERLDFWLDYWLATYRHMLAQAGRDRLHLIRFESLGEGRDLGPLAAAIGYADVDDLRRRGAALRAAEPHATADQACDPQVIEAARCVYRELCARALV